MILVQVKTCIGGGGTDNVIAPYEEGTKSNTGRKDWWAQGKKCFCTSWLGCKGARGEIQHLLCSARERKKLDRKKESPRRGMRAFLGTFS